MVGDDGSVVPHRAGEPPSMAGSGATDAAWAQLGGADKAPSDVA